MPDISVVIPTFRRPMELRQAIESVLGQKDVSIEIIVVDDCPNGSAKAVVESFMEQPILYLRNPAPTGGRPAVVRNLGWPLASGTYVHFLDDDDLVPVGRYAQVKSVFEAHPHISVVLGRIEPFGFNAPTLSHEQQYFVRADKTAKFCRRFGSRFGFAAALSFGSTFAVCSAGLIRRECLPVLNGFDARMKLCEDVDFYARAVRRFGAVYTDELALHYRIGPSLMHRPDTKAQIDESYRLMSAGYRQEWGRLDALMLQSFTKVSGV